MHFSNALSSLILSTEHGKAAEIPGPACLGGTSWVRHVVPHKPPSESIFWGGEQGSPGPGCSPLARAVYDSRRAEVCAVFRD